MRFDLHALDRATDGFFGAALDPALWPVVLEKVSVATRSYGVNIVPIEGRLFHTFIVTESLAPAMEDYFAGEWHKRDFRSRHVPMMRQAGVVLEQDFAGEDDFKTVDFYRAQARFGLRWSAMIGFSSGDDLLAFALQRRIEDGPYSQDEARSLLAYVRNS